MRNTMKSSSEISKIIIICLMTATIRLYGANVANPPVPGEIKKLITQLGSADFAEREKATKHLLQLGYYSRNEVQKELKNRDPEIRMRLKTIWKEIRWQSFPGAGKDVKELLDKIEPVASWYKEWDNLAEKYGPKLLLMMQEINTQPKYTKQTLNVLKALLKNNSPNSIAAYISESPEKNEIIDIIKGLRIDRLSKSESLKLINVFHLLNMKKEVVAVTADVWESGNSTQIPEIVLGYFTSKSFTDSTFRAAIEKLNESESSSENDWYICFFAKLAKDINRQDLIKALVYEIDYNITDERAGIYLSEILISMSLFPEAINALSELQTPKAVYLRAVAYNNAGEKKRSQEMMKIMYEKLDTEENCFSVAEEMSKFNDVRSVTLWLKILQMKPDDSIYDANAHFRLASFYDAKGKYGKAADMLETGMKQKKGIFLVNERGNVSSGQSAEARISAKIADLRAQENGGAETWYNAMKAMHKKEFSKAMELFDEFITKNPDYYNAYLYRSAIFEKRGDIDKAISEVNQAIQCVNTENSEQKVSLLIRKSILLRGENKYDGTIETLKEAVKLVPENEEIMMMLAMTTFYGGYYKEAAELFRKSHELNPDDLYAPIWRYISEKCILPPIQGLQPEQAFANFADMLQGNEWPIPIIRFYSGKITEKECLKAAEDKDKKRENEKMCEAYYFIGKFLLISGKKQDAEKLFKKCIECNITDFREHKAALQELSKQTSQ